MALERKQGFFRRLFGSEDYSEPPVPDAPDAAVESGRAD